MFSSRTQPDGLLSGLLVAFVAISSSVASASSASSDSDVVVLGVCSGGRPDARAAGDVVTRLRQYGEQAKLAAHGGGTRGGCADKESLGKLAADLNAQRLLQAQIQETDRDNQKYLLTLRLYDSATGRVDELPLDCDGCAADNRNEQLAIAASELLKKVESTPAPREPGSLAVSKKPPEQLDQPRVTNAEKIKPDLVNPIKSGPDDERMPSQPRPGIDRKLSKFIEGTLWGLTGLTGAVAIGLAIANKYTPPNVSMDGSTYDIENAYANPAWAMAGTSVGLLGISIVVTAVIEKTLRKTAPRSTQPKTLTVGWLTIPQLQVNSARRY